VKDQRDRERARLEVVSEVYDPSNPEEEFDFFTKRLHRQAMSPWLHGDRVLEMGCATGELTTLLSPLAKEYHVVEGSARNIEVSRVRAPQVTFFESLWEEFNPDDRYTDVLLVCALEHVEDPVDILRRARAWLVPGGRLHLIVPNADSLHRFVGVAMGMLPERTALSESDHRIGHRRVYTIDTLLADVEAAALTSLHWQGIFLKVLSNRQMLGWDWALIEAMHVVGQRFPAHCAELYVVATAA